MAKKILIANIKIDRDLESGDDLSDLGPESLKTPIVVRDDVLIDGLRRITLATKLGIEEISAVDPKTLEEACAALARNHKRHQPSWQRIVEIHPYLAKLTNERLRKIRSEQSTGLTKFQRWDPNRVRVTPARDLISQAYAGVKPNQWERLIALIATGREDLVQDVIAGKTTPAAAYVKSTDRRSPFRGTVTNAREQYEMLVAAAAAMKATISAVQRIAKPINIKPEQAKPVISDLYKIRATLSTMIHQLEEAVGK